MLHGLPQNLAFRFFQFEFAVNGRGGQKSVNTRPITGRHHGFRAPLNVLFQAARQSRNTDALDLFRNGFHGFKIARTGYREARFNNIHLQTLQLTGNLQFFTQAHARTGALLAVAQRCVEYNHAILIFCFHRCFLVRL